MLFCREEIFVANLRTFGCKISSPQNVPCVKKWTNIRYVSVVTWTDKLFISLYIANVRGSSLQSSRFLPELRRTSKEILFIGDRCVFWPHNCNALAEHRIVIYHNEGVFWACCCSKGEVYKRGTESYTHSGPINLAHALDLRTSHSPPNKYICSGLFWTDTFVVVY